MLRRLRAGRGGGCLRGTDEGADEGADGEEGDDEALAHDAEFAGGEVARGMALGEAEDKVVHEQDVGDLARVILVHTHVASVGVVWGSSLWNIRTPKMNCVRWKS